MLAVTAWFTATVVVLVSTHPLASETVAVYVVVVVGVAVGEELVVLLREFPGFVQRYVYGAVPPMTVVVSTELPPLQMVPGVAEILNAVGAD